MTNLPASSTEDRPAAAPVPHTNHALAVGAAGFAWCSLALGLSTVGAISAAGSSIILAGTFFYGGIVQVVAGFFALASGAGFAAAFLCSYGAFWLGYTGIEVYVAPHIVSAVLASPASAGLSKSALAAAAGHTVATSLGVFLISWLVVTVIFTVVSVRTNVITAVAFGLLDLTIILLILAYLGASAAGVAQSGALHAAGYAEIVLGLVAFYLVLAELLNEVVQREVLPLFPLTNRTAPALRAGLAA
ncbi:MAG TPA: acetate uptake transporter [Pseudonocardiaceae bacterium]|jgi:hypothetical protein|nr:acetate uptake transporter [Pseudonocardiaceae bacterium]